MLFGEDAAHLQARRVDGPPCDGRVRAREVDVFEDASRPLRLGPHVGLDVVFADGEELAGADLPLEFGADDVQCRGFRRHDPSAVEPAEHEGAETVPVARGIEVGFVHESKGESPLQARKDVQGRIGEALRVDAAEQRGENRRVRGGAAAELAREVLARARTDLFHQLRGVREIPVVGQRDGSRMRVARRRACGRR